jgi:hypothetical protein
MKRKSLNMLNKFNEYFGWVVMAILAITAPITILRIIMYIIGE